MEKTAGIGNDRLDEPLDNRVPVGALVPGMFVSRLDRPWTSTPFLMQGFLIRGDREIESLRQHCQFVYVDPVKSTVRSKPLQRRQVTQPPATVKLSSSTRRSVWNWFAGLLHDIFANDRSPPEEPNEERQLDALAVLRLERGALISSPELVRAREIFTRSQEALNSIINDVQSDRKLVIGCAHEAVMSIIEGIDQHRQALFWLTQLKSQDSDLYQHAINVAIYMVSFGRHLGLPRDQLHVLGLAGLLQNVGMIKIPPEILARSTRLSAAEHEIVKGHVQHSLTILRQARDLPEELFAVIAQHHERHDGSGYLCGLRGPQIHPLARISGIADTFDAMASPQPFTSPLTLNEALQQLYAAKGSDFQAGLVEQFIQFIGIFPVGTLVELNSGEVGIVVAQNAVRRLKPRLLLLLDGEKHPYEAPVVLDLIKDPTIPDNRPYCILRDLPSGAFGINPKDYSL
jgi:HD-GYP domain-containing protein (c-di-GMP phosphodiesterase class II)